MQRFATACVLHASTTMQALQPPSPSSAPLRLKSHWTLLLLLYHSISPPPSSFHGILIFPPKTYCALDCILQARDAFLRQPLILPDPRFPLTLRLPIRAPPLLHPIPILLVQAIALNHTTRGCGHKVVVQHVVLADLTHPTSRTLLPLPRVQPEIARDIGVNGMDGFGFVGMNNLNGFGFCGWKREGYLILSTYNYSTCRARWQCRRAWGRRWS